MGFSDGAGSMDVVKNAEAGEAGIINIGDLKSHFFRLCETVDRMV